MTASTIWSDSPETEATPRCRWTTGQPMSTFLQVWPLLFFCLRNFFRKQSKIQIKKSLDTTYSISFPWGHIILHKLFSNCKPGLRNMSPRAFTCHSTGAEHTELQPFVLQCNCATSGRLNSGRGLKGHLVCGQQRDDRGWNRGWPIGQIKLPACISPSQVSRSSTATEYK